MRFRGYRSEEDRKVSGGKSRGQGGHDGVLCYSTSHFPRPASALDVSLASASHLFLLRDEIPYVGRRRGWHHGVLVEDPELILTQRRPRNVHRGARD